MSTYTKYHVRVKENLSRLRNPGNADDGISPDRVIFSNPENIYYGTFAGSLSASGSEFDNVTINGGTLNNVGLNGVTISSGN